MADPVGTIKIRFKADTAVDLARVGTAHYGRSLYRPYTGTDPEHEGEMESYFPKGTVIDLPGYVENGVAELVVEGP